MTTSRSSTPLASNGSTIQVSALRAGKVIDLNIYDHHGVLLLSQGSMISERFIQRLLTRGIFEVQGRRDMASELTMSGRRAIQSQEDGMSDTVCGSSVCGFMVGGPKSITYATDASQNIDRILEEAPAQVMRSLPPAANPRRLTLEALRTEHARAVEGYREGSEQLCQLMDDVSSKRTKNFSSAAKALIKPMMKMISLDPSLAALAMDLRSSPQEYLYNHGMNVALLAMNIATHMGYGEADVRTAGVASLLQDIGMLRVPDEVRFAKRDLSEKEWENILRHPIRSIDRIASVERIDPAIMVVAYQSHERCDGSGYPRGRRQMFIHAMARIVAVADTFAAITCNRPHRTSRSPYAAMNILLKEAKRNVLDKSVVRATLECMSLFPLGSYVRLSNGTSARVLRTKGEDYQRPVVVPLNSDGSETDEELDLASAREISVVATLDESEIGCTPGSAGNSNAA
jgi:HD-GYP domain-containing protein (c-di-GMP phosphodiesterase class II)